MNTITILDPVANKTKIEHDFRYAEKVRNLDERTALKIALALAGYDKELFLLMHEMARTANLMPAGQQSLPKLAPIILHEIENKVPPKA